ncbi:MAG: squalene synthase HpnC [Planctomycetaceae bacterium]|nr:squalene synthase HpnC [Planctomycetaceae bacterium]
MSTVIEDLAKYGPQTSGPPVSLPEAEAYCRRLAVGHYENFPVASWLVPAPLRQHFYNVYAFCRWSDDLGDETGDPVRSLILLDWWRTELARCYTGEVRHPVFVALRPTIERFGIPEGPFADLISAFEQDQRQTRYETFAELENYCQRSANPVGRIVLFLMEQNQGEQVQWSDAICTGLQLANFWQDVSRDLEIGRVYLPQEDLRRFAYSEEELAARTFDDRFRDLMIFQIERTRSYFDAGQELPRRLPGRIGLEIGVVLAGGRVILREIERIDYNVLRTRPTVSKGQLLRAGWQLFWQRTFGKK